MKLKDAITNLSVSTIAAVKIDDIQFVTCRILDNSVTPYVTWSMDQEGRVYWGHYFSGRREALKDMFERCGANLY